MLERAKSNLPDPDYTELVGRDEELRTLKLWLGSQPRQWIVPIEGTGGIGKTALALEICRYYQREYERLPRDERYDYIIWTSAKIEDMTPSGRVQRPGAQATLRAILSTIAEVMDIREALTAGEDRQLAFIREALSHNRVLLVVDSFEQLENPAPVVEFLHDDLASPSKALLTCRPQQTVEVIKSISLEGLEEEEGLRLIKQMCDARGSTDLNESQQRELYQLTFGVPLVIMWALGRILDLERPYSSVVSKLKMGDVDLSGYCVADSFQVVRGRKAEEIAFALLPLHSPVSRQMIGEVVGVSKEIETRDEELRVLVALQLVARDRQDKFRIAPLARAHLLSLHDQSGRGKIAEKWARYYRDFVTALLGKHGRVDAYSRELGKIWSEMDNILEVLGSIAEANPQLYCDLLEAMRYILYMRGDWIARDQYMLQGIEAGDKSNDPCRKLLFASDVAWVASYRGQYERAFRFFQSVEPALDGCPEAYYRAKFYHDLARLYHLNAYEKADLVEAETLYLKALEEAKKGTTVPAMQSTCLYYLGLLYYDFENRGEARKRFQEGLEVAESHGATREADRHRSMLALLLADNGQYHEARKLFDRIVVNAEGHGDLVRVADYKFAQAKVEYKSGNRRGAQALLAEAERFYNNLGRVQDANAVIHFRRETGLIDTAVFSSVS